MYFFAVMKACYSFEEKEYIIVFFDYFCQCIIIIEY